MVKQRPIPVDVAEYLYRTPADKRDGLLPVFDFLQQTVPAEYVLEIQYGLPCWVIPAEHPRNPASVALANVGISPKPQRNGLYLFGIYSNPILLGALTERWDPGLPLRMSRSCVYFDTITDLDTRLLTELISGHTVDEFLTHLKLPPKPKSPPFKS